MSPSALPPAAAASAPPAPLLRVREPADEDFLRALDAELCCAQQGLGALPPALLAPLLAQQYAAREAGHRQRFPGGLEQVVWVDGARAGRLWTHRAPDALWLVDVALSARVRGGGLGTRLVRALQAEAARAGVPLRLTVRKDNPARRLYARLGFTEAATSELDLQLIWSEGPLAPVEEME